MKCPLWELIDLGTVKQQIEELKVGKRVFFLHMICRCHGIRCVQSLLFLSSSLSCNPEQQYKVEVYQQQIDMEKLCHQGELLLKKVSDHTDRDMIQEPLIELRHLWENLGDKITQRQVLRPRVMQRSWNRLLKASRQVLSLLRSAGTHDATPPTSDPGLKSKHEEKKTN